MAEVFKNAGVILGDTDTLVYTCPAGNVSVIIGCQVTQEDVDLLDLDLWWDNAANSNFTTYLGKSIKIPPEVSYNPIGGKVVLKEGDSFHAKSSVDALMYITLSVLEIS